MCGIEETVATRLVELSVLMIFSEIAGQQMCGLDSFRGSDGEVTRYKARLVIVFKRKGKKAQIDRGTEETLATRLVELRLC